MSINFGGANIGTLVSGDNSGNTGFYYERTKSVSGISNSVYTTIFTITRIRSGEDWVSTFVDITAAGSTNGSGGGSRFSRWYISLNSTTPSTAQVSSVTGNTYPPDIQIIASGNTFSLQLRGNTLSGGSNTFVGMYHIKFYSNAGLLDTAYWTVT